MNKALFTALVVVLITGLLLGRASSMLRAGRDKIMMPRNSAKQQLQLKPEVYNRVKPVYLRKASYRRKKPLEYKQGIARFLAFCKGIFELYK